MKPMKRLSALVLTAALALALTGCGDSPASPSPAESLPPLKEVTLDGHTSPAESTAPADSAPLEDTAPPEEEVLPEEDVSPAASEYVPAGDDSTGEPSLELEFDLDPDGSYTTAEDVSAYLITYGELPQNFITKKEAKALGWPGGNLEPYAPGKCIGGDRFGNYEGLLPEDRDYHECDIDTLGAKSRGAKRLVFSDDGLIYYTEDHYETFELLYGEE